MSRLRDEIMSLPPADRLEAALRAIDELCGHSDAGISALIRRFDISETGARILLALNARAPAVISRETLLRIVYGHDAEVGDRIIDVYLSRARAAIPVLQIHGVRGLGWSLAERFDVAALCDDPKSGPPRRMLPTMRASLRHWTQQEDDELLRMRRNRSEWSAIADELDRSQAACRHRWATLTAVPAEMEAV